MPIQNWIFTHSVEHPPTTLYQIAKILECDLAQSPSVTFLRQITLGINGDIFVKTRLDAETALHYRENHSGRTIKALDFLEVLPREFAELFKTLKGTDVQQLGLLDLHNKFISKMPKLAYSLNF